MTLDQIGAAIARLVEDTALRPLPEGEELRAWAERALGMPVDSAEWSDDRGSVNIRLRPVTEWVVIDLVKR
jgi:hypothetical protein